LTRFADHNSHVAEFQVLKFLNVDGAQIVFEHGSLANSVQDNGFSVQSEYFDYLLDLDGNIIRPSGGEVYVPISYFQDGTAAPGDRMTVTGVEFTVAGVLRDSQMNSPLSCPRICPTPLPRESSSPTWASAIWSSATSPRPRAASCSGRASSAP